MEEENIQIRPKAPFATHVRREHLPTFQVPQNVSPVRQEHFLLREKNNVQDVPQELFPMMELVFVRLVLLEHILHREILLYVLIVLPELFLLLDWQNVKLVLSELIL